MTWLSEHLYKEHYRDRIHLSSEQPTVIELAFCIRLRISCFKSTVMSKTALVVKVFISDGARTNSSQSVDGYYPRCRIPL